MKFVELVDISELRELCESFTTVTDAVTAILDLEGNILIATGWQDICTRFHRVNPQTACRCTESDTVLAGQLKKGETYNVYKCKNGLVDVAVPIVVGGEHVANLFTGQFFLEPPSREFFIRQAEEFGFDKQAYLDALSRVPVHTESQVRMMMHFFAHLARLIGEMGLAAKQLEAANAELRSHQEHLEELVEQRTSEIAASKKKYFDLYENAPDMYVLADAITGAIVQCNVTLSAAIGCSRDEIVGRPVTELFHPDSVDEANKAFRLFADGEVHDLELILRRKDGSKLDVSLSVSPVTDESGAVLYSNSTLREISVRKKMEDTLRFIAQRGWFGHAVDFLTALATYLGKTFAVDYVIIDRLAEGDPGFAKTMALYAKGSLLPSMRYPLCGTPCENVMGKALCCYPQGVQQLFPADHLLVEMGVESYAGVPLWDSEGRAIGLIAVMDSKPLLDGSTLASILQLVAISAAAALERERSDEALAERMMLAELSADIGFALAKQDDLRSILNACVEALVRRLDVAFARIWVLNAAENVLELQASAGMYTRIDGIHSRVPVGEFKIGLIAKERKPHITNAVMGDPRVHDQEWAKREGMVAFAGHPLTIEDKLVGVMALFSRHPLSDVTLKALAAGSTEIAIGIERKLAEEKLQRLNRELRAISSCNQILMRTDEEQILLNDICRIVCEEAGYRLAWVGYSKNDDAGTIRPVALAGTEIGHIEQAGFTWDDTERGRGPAGSAIRSGKSVCIQDFVSDPQDAPWRDSALQHGYRSCIALPLKGESGNTFGNFNIYSTEPNAFTPDEILLLEELAGDLAFGIMVLRGRSERKSMEQERLANLIFFESMDQINRAIQGTNDLQQMMSDVLDAVLEIFDCDRAWLLYPCDPEAASWSVPMERTKPEYPGANVQGLVIPMDPEVQRMFRIQRGTDSPISWGPGCDRLYPEWLTEKFGVRSQLSVSTCPKTGQPWQFGMHQCSYARIWTQEEKRLFQEISRRLADSLTSLLSYHDLLESEAKYRRLVDTSNEGIWMLGEDLMTTFVNARMAELLGCSFEEMLGRPITDFMFTEDIHDHYQRMETRRRGVSEHYERRYRHKNGQAVWTLASAVPIMDEQQNFKGTFGMFTDITDRKHAEEGLHKLNEELDDRVKQRTAELEAKNKELEKFNRLFVNRELRMKELKEKLSMLECKKESPGS